MLFPGLVCLFGNSSLNSIKLRFRGHNFDEKSMFVTMLRRYYKKKRGRGAPVNMACFGLLPALHKGKRNMILAHFDGTSFSRALGQRSDCGSTPLGSCAPEGLPAEVVGV